MMYPMQVNIAMATSSITIFMHFVYYFICQV